MYQATLKDERRTLDRVKAAKTRVFEASPMEYSLAVRQYFAAFISHVQTNRIDNEIGVGTNVYSLDWHRTGLALQRHGKHVIAGDFSGFDGSLLAQVLWRICDLVNQWYDDGEENAMIRRNLFEEIVHARVLVRGELIQQTHSQPSGNPLTVIINSLFNMIIMRYAYLTIKRENNLGSLCDFKDHVSLQCFGDDNVLNISGNVIRWFNQVTISKALKDVGMTYTDEAKTGKIVESRTLDSIKYLKRSFHKDKNGYFIAPLELYVICDMVLWVRGNRSRAATIENVETALAELALHSRHIFNKYSKAWIEVCRAEGLEIRAYTYDEYRDELQTSQLGQVGASSVYSWYA